MRFKKIRALALVSTILFVTNSSLAQDSIVTSDFELWSGISLEKSFFEKKLELALSEEFRFDENSTHLNKYFTELGVTYEMIKGLRFGIGYRFIRNDKKAGYVNEQRIFAQLGYKHKIDRFTLDYRFQFQNEDQIGLKREEGDEVTQKYRLRLKASYNIKNWKLDPYISAEGFFTQQSYLYNYIETIDEFGKYRGFEKMRFTIGTSYKIKKYLKIGAYYRIEREFKSYPATYGMPATYYIGGLNITFKL